jgi:hypothetical protein
MPGSWCSSSCSPCIGASRLSLFSNHSFSILSHAPQAERQSGLPPSVKKLTPSCDYVATLYTTLCSQLATCRICLLPPELFVIHDSRDTFVTADQGHVRRHNDRTLEARARHFTSWIEAAGFAVDNFGPVAVGSFPSILAAYLAAVAARDYYLQLTALGPAALRGYVAAASDTITLLPGTACSYLDPATLWSKRPKILPMLGEIICQRSAWKEPLPRKEPFTLAMIDALRACFLLESTKTSVAQVFLISEHAVCDWLRVGLFAGSRISEHGQTSSSESPGCSRFAHTPNSSNAGIWANQPLAFIEADFVFFNRASLLIDNHFCLVNTALDHIHEIHLRFRFDKLKPNFTIRKCIPLPSAPFNPVIATINVIRRGHILGLPPTERMGQCRAISSSFNSMLRDSNVSNHLCPARLSRSSALLPCSHPRPSRPFHPHCCSSVSQARRRL